ncbi:MAG: AhpC/TSA family protein [Prevotella sp.]|nr:AhpC/TSA family protein [Prevotella sp.]
MPRGMWVKRFLPFYLFTFLLLFLSSCGVDSNKFRLTGRLRNLNQGMFWIYSPDGAIEGIDTIQVRDGRFSYETELRVPATLIVIFPNYSEQPVFAEPGEEVDIKGNASQMKEMIIKGTDDNDAMTELRMELNELMPPEVPKAVAKFINENPTSRVSRYLLQRYFLTDPQADLEQAYILASLMQKEDPDDIQLTKWKQELNGLRNGQLNKRLSDFSAKDVKGRDVSLSDLKSKVNVITVWATWNYQSTDIQRRLQRMKKRNGDRLSVISVCLDADYKKCKQTLERDSVPWKTICDGRMWQTPVLSKLGIADVPGNLVLDDKGVVQARNLNPQKLEEKILQMLR